MSLQRQPLVNEEKKARVPACLWPGRNVRRPHLERSNPRDPVERKGSIKAMKTVVEEP